MYVIHPLIIFFSAMLFKDINLPSVIKYIVAYAFVVGATIFLSWLSYEYFEKRFLKIKARFTAVASSNTRIDNET